MKNPFKRTDVFTCSYETHKKFNNRVSAWHVMREKQCYPQGCISFKWYCDQLNKGKRCHRKFNYVGRLCEGCSHYRDEKIHHQPRINISKPEFDEFLETVEEFEEWVAEHANRDLNIYCRIGSVKPRFQKKMSDGKGHLYLQGYLLVVENGFIGLTEIEDLFYVYISPNQQNRFQFAPHDVFEARGRMRLDRGRILFSKVWQIDFEQRSDMPTWDNSRALIARQSATQFQYQPESCIKCPNGALIDVVHDVNNRPVKRRELYCLEGIKDPKQCYIKAFASIDLCRNEK